MRQIIALLVLCTLIGGLLGAMLTDAFWSMVWDTTNGRFIAGALIYIISVSISLMIVAED